MQNQPSLLQSLYLTRSTSFPPLTLYRPIVSTLPLASTASLARKRSDGPSARTHNAHHLPFPTSYTQTCPLFSSNPADQERRPQPLTTSPVQHTDDPPRQPRAGARRRAAAATRPSCTPHNCTQFSVPPARLLAARDLPPRLSVLPYTPGIVTCPGKAAFGPLLTPSAPTQQRQHAMRPLLYRKALPPSSPPSVT